MNKQDAIKCLKSIQQWVPDCDDREDGLSYWDAIDMAIDALDPPNEALTLEQLREMKDKPAYLNVFDSLLESGWHIIKAVTEDKIIFRGWQTVYVPIDGMGIDYNLYRRPSEGEV